MAAAERDLEEARRILSAARVSARLAEAKLGAARKDLSMGRDEAWAARRAAEAARREEERAEALRARAVLARRRLLSLAAAGGQVVPRKARAAASPCPPSPRRSEVAAMREALQELRRAETDLTLARARLSQARRLARAAEAFLGHLRKQPGVTKPEVWEAQGEARRAREAEQAAERVKRGVVMVRRKLLSWLQ